MSGVKLTRIYHQIPLDTIHLFMKKYELNINLGLNVIVRKVHGILHGS
jgi:hypothetical protein